ELAAKLASYADWMRRISPPNSFYITTLSRSLLLTTHSRTLTFFPALSLTHSRPLAHPFLPSVSPHSHSLLLSPSLSQTHTHTHSLSHYHTPILSLTLTHTCTHTQYHYVFSSYTQMWKYLAG